MAEAFFTPLFSKEGVGEIYGRINILMLLLQIPPAPLSKGGISLCKEYGAHIFVADPLE